MADSSKTEQATDRRKLKAREQGQVARSRELPGVFALAAVTAVTMLMTPTAVTHWGALYRETLFVAATQNLDANGPVLFWSAIEVLRWIVPILLAGLGVSLLTGFMQGGINFAPEALQPKFERFNPASKLGQIFSPVGLSNLGKSLLPFGAILWITVGAMRDNWQTMVNASSLGLRNFASFVGQVIFAMAWKAGLILLGWSVVDYVLTLKKMQSDMKMTKQEVREEYKETEGNPVIKQRVRQVQRAMRRKQSLMAAATATVVVTNPTHFAVALKYEQDMAAPIVVAKGLDLLAEKIKAIARENGIMTIENRPLAQALYKTVEVGDRQQTFFTVQTLANIMQRMGVQIAPGVVVVKNVAAVFVTASLPAFARPGMKMDVTVSSVGDAKSLEGGVLLFTALRGIDGQVYAEAQGPMTIGGYSEGAVGNTKTVNHPTVGRIAEGGTIERGVAVDLSRFHTVSLLLRNQDFTAARDIAAAINSDFAKTVATAVDSSRVDVSVADSGVASVPNLIARVQRLAVSLSAPARVVVNERTGTIVMGGDVKLSPVSVIHGSLTIEVQTDFAVSQPSSFSKTGGTTAVPETRVTVKDAPARSIQMKEGANVDELIKGLHAIGATSHDIIAILQAIKAAGGLQAELEVI